MSSYTLAEVAGHDGKSETGLWIIIKNFVYDVTEYVNEHPGGEALFLEYAGKDATSGFNDFGHSSDAIYLLKIYKIGQLTESGKQEMKIKTSKRKRRIFFPLFGSCAT